VGLMVHFEAVKLGLKGIPAQSGWVKGLQDWHLLLPLVVLVFLLLKHFSPMYSVIYSIFTLLVVCQFRKGTRMGLFKILSALEQGARGVLPIMTSCAGAGIIVGIVFVTGLGARFSAYIVEFSAGNLILSLLTAMVVAILLGMGLPTTAAYILQVALVVPALIKMGLPVHIAHLFVLYYSGLSLITPPVAITSYAAAGIAGSSPMRTSLEACKLTAAVYLIPMMFVFSPSLLMIGNPVTVVITVITALFGISIFAAGVEGYLLVRMAFWERGMAIAGGILLLKPGIFTDAAGFLMILTVLAAQISKRRTTRQ